MKKQIQEVEQYFMHCIEKGNFNVIEASENGVKISIEDKVFSFLHVSNGDYFLTGYGSFMLLDYKEINFSEIDKVFKSTAKEAKLKAIEKLQEELNKL